MTRAIGWAAVACAAVGLAVGAVAAWPGDEPGRPAKPAPANADAGQPDKPEPKAGEEGDRLAAATRPRLVKTFELAGRVSSPIWSLNGDLLAVRREGDIWVMDTRKQVARGAVATGATETAVGFLADKPIFVTFSVGRGRINAEQQLRFWELSDIPDSVRRPTRTTDLDPEDGTPVAVLPDGKAVLAVRFDRKLLPPPKETSRFGPGFAAAPGYEVVAARYRVIDVATGKAGPDLVRLPGGGHHYPFAVTPAGDRLIVASKAGNSVAVECLALPDGKPVWAKRIAPDAPAAVYAPFKLHLSGDGRLLAMTYIRTVRADEGGKGNPFATAGRTRPPGTGAQRESTSTVRVLLLDPTTGADGPKLDEPGAGSEPDARPRGHVIAHGLSHDGRMLAAVGEEAGAVTLQIWDTRAGKVVKSWEGSAEAAFAPDRPVLAVLESFEGRTRDGANASGGVLGFWDLSALTR